MKQMDLILVAFALVLGACGKDKQATSLSQIPIAQSPTFQGPAVTRQPSQPIGVVPTATTKSSQKSCYGVYGWTAAGVVAQWRFSEDGTASYSIESPGMATQVVNYSKEHCDIMRSKTLNFSDDCSKLYLGAITYTR